MWWAVCCVVAGCQASSVPRGERLEAMRAWAGVKNDKFEIVEDEFGFGLRTKGTIARHETILSVKRASCLSARDAPAWARGSKSSLLAARLCVERHLPEGDYGPLLASLDEPAAPASWSDDEAQLIAGTRAARAREALLRQWKVDWVSHQCSWEDFTWAKAIVASRCYVLDEEIGPVFIPVADLANHDDNDFCALDVDRNEDGHIILSLVATRPLVQGEAVLTNYFGGRRLDPVHALDAFGWLERDFVHFSSLGLTCETIQELDHKGVDTLRAFELVSEALRQLELARDIRQQAALRLVDKSSASRLELAKAIVESEVRILERFRGQLRRRLGGEL